MQLENIGWHWRKLYAPPQVMRKKNHITTIMNVSVVDPGPAGDVTKYPNNSVVLITGDGACMPEDVKLFESWGIPHDLYCINRSMLYFERHVDHWAAIDIEESGWFAENVNFKVEPIDGRKIVRHTIGDGSFAYDVLYFLRGSIVEGAHLFRAPFARGTWKLAGPAQRLTSGGGNYLNLSVAPNGQMLFSNVDMEEDFTSVQLPPKGSAASSPLARITSDATIKGSLYVSKDGSTAAYFAFVSWESGRLEIRVRNLAAGRELVHTSEHLPGGACPEISPDGFIAGIRRAD